MKKKFSAIIGKWSQSITEFFRFLFRSPGENQIQLQKCKREESGGVICLAKFKSYTQLKKYQQHLRRYSMSLFTGLVFIVAGILVSPIIFPTEVPAEVYIPNGKGDILIGNVSKNQFTVVFKTLDAAHNNKPLATTSFVEVYGDPNMKDLVRRTDTDDYAVTHIINIDKLGEERMYYLKIIATDSSSDEANPERTASVASWGVGEPIKAFTIGDYTTLCDRTQQNQNNEGAQLKSAETVPATRHDEIITGIMNELMGTESIELNSEKIAIMNVQKESHIYDSKKIQTIISWDTFEPSTTVLLYHDGKGGEEKKIVVSEEMKTKHLAVIMTFEPATVYYFRVQSTDAQGKTVTSDEYSILTPRPRESILQVIGNNMKLLVRQVLPK